MSATRGVVRRFLVAAESTVEGHDVIYKDADIRPTKTEQTEKRLLRVDGGAREPRQ